MEQDTARLLLKLQPPQHATSTTLAPVTGGAVCEWPGWASAENMDAYSSGWIGGINGHGGEKNSPRTPHFDGGQPIGGRVDEDPNSAPGGVQASPADWPEGAVVAAGSGSGAVSAGTDMAGTIGLGGWTGACRWVGGGDRGHEPTIAELPSPDADGGWPTDEETQPQGGGAGGACGCDPCRLEGDGGLGGMGEDLCLEWSWD